GGAAQAERALLDQVLERQSTPAVLAGDRDDQPHVLFDQSVVRFLGRRTWVAGRRDEDVLTAHPARQRPLPVRAEEGTPRDVAEEERQGVELAGLVVRQEGRLNRGGPRNTFLFEDECGTRFLGKNGVDHRSPGLWYSRVEGTASARARAKESLRSRGGE